MRPFFPFYGSKWNAARRYPAPRYDLVVEPFAGSASYATYYDAPRALLIDADPIVCGVWDYLQRVSGAELAALPDLPCVGDSVDAYAIPAEAKHLIGFWINRGSSTPKRTRTAYSTRTDLGQLTWGPRAKARIAAQVERIRGWRVLEGSYTVADDVEATWFIDPPYVDKGRSYRVRFSGHAELGAWCHTRRGQVIVCEAPGATWLPFEPFESFKSSRGRADEVAWVRP